VSQIGIRQTLRALCADTTVDGVLVQLPLPAHIDEEDVIEHFDPSKDVDGFHPLNVGRTLMRGRCARFVPCTALGCIELLRRSGLPIQGKSVAIVGDSNIVGMPLAMLFRDEGAATVTVIHRTTYASLFSTEGRASEAHQVEVSVSCCFSIFPWKMLKHLSRMGWHHFLFSIGLPLPFVIMPPRTRPIAPYF